MSLIIAIGQKGSGKSTFLNYVAEHGYKVTELHEDFLLVNNRLPLDQKISTDDQWQSCWMISAVYNAVYSHRSSSLLFLSGIYREEEVEFLRGNGEDVYIVWIESSPENCVKRVKLREGMSFDMDTYVQEVNWRNGLVSNHAENDIKTLKKYASWKLCNNHDLKSFKKEIEALLNSNLLLNDLKQ